ncbi:MAG: YtxH domain-containing protein [Bdellovibrionia bacterium]
MTLEELKAMGKDDLLKSIGLQEYRSAAWSAVPGAAFFGVGLLVGAGIGLLFAPRTGQELRDDISDRFNSMKDRVSHKATQTADNIQSAAESYVGP